MSCEKCGGKVIVEFLTAREILNAMSDVPVIVLIRMDIDAIREQMFKQVLRVLDRAYLRFLGNEQVIVTFCENCGIYYCGFCKNPLIMDTWGDSFCIFCGGF